MVQDSTTRIAALEAEVAKLQAQLAKAQGEAEVERERFERRLKLAQTALPDRRDPQVVTQNIAAMQEVDALRGALRERDRIVKELTDQVRNLEDQLEDHYRRTDEVQRELRKRDQELDEARRQSALAARRAEAMRTAAAPAPARAERQPQPLTQAPQRNTDLLTFAVGMLVGLVLALAIVAVLWWTGTLPAPPSFASSAAPRFQPIFEPIAEPVALSVTHQTVAPQPSLRPAAV